LSNKFCSTDMRGLHSAVNSQTALALFHYNETVFIFSNEMQNVPVCFYL